MSEDFETSDREMEVDLTGVTGDIFPDGEYEFRLVNVERNISASGNPKYEWTFRGPKELKGKTFKVHTALTPDAMWKLAETAEALALGKPGEKTAFKRRDAIGRRCLGTIAVEEYNGKERSSIRKLRPHPGGVDKQEGNEPF